HDLAVGEHRDRSRTEEVDAHVESGPGGLATKDSPVAQALFLKVAKQLGLERTGVLQERLERHVSDLAVFDELVLLLELPDRGVEVLPEDVADLPLLLDRREAHTCEGDHPLDGHDVLAAGALLQYPDE